MNKFKKIILPLLMLFGISFTTFVIPNHKIETKANINVEKLPTQHGMAPASYADAVRAHLELSGAFVVLDTEVLCWNYSDQIFNENETYMLEISTYSDDPFTYSYIKLSEWNDEYQNWWEIDYAMSEGCIDHMMQLPEDFGYLANDSFPNKESMQWLYFMLNTSLRPIIEWDYNGDIQDLIDIQLFWDDYYNNDSNYNGNVFLSMSNNADNYIRKLFMLSNVNVDGRDASLMFNGIQYLFYSWPMMEAGKVFEIEFEFIVEIADHSYGGFYKLKCKAFFQVGKEEPISITKLNTPEISYRPNNVGDPLLTINSVPNASAYEILYYQGDELVETQTRTQNQAGIELPLQIAPGAYTVKVRAISDNQFYSPSDPTTGFEINVSFPVIKKGVTLENLAPRMTSWKHPSEVQGALLEGYQTHISYKNLVVSSQNFTENVGAYFDYNKVLPAGTYYIRFETAYNISSSENLPIQINLLGVNGTTYLEMPISFTTINTSFWSFTFTTTQSYNLSKIVIDYSKLANQYPYLNRAINTSHSIKNFMFFNLSKSYNNEIPTKSYLDSFFTKYGYIDYQEFTSNPIIGPQKLYTNCTNSLTSSNIISNYQNLEGKEFFLAQNNYSANQSRPGSYSVIIAYYDNLSIARYRTIEIVVSDNVAPTILIADAAEADDHIISFLSSPLSIAEIISKLNVSDNADGNIKHLLTYDATSYLANKNTPGTYAINFEVIDSAGNKTTRTIYIDVMNDLGPIFEAPSVIYKSTDIVFNANDILKTISHVIDQEKNYYHVFNGSGDFDNDHFTIVQDTFTGQANKVGSYILKIKATDDKNRVSFHTFTINVLKDIPDIVYYNKTIIVGKDITLSNQQILTLANRLGMTMHNTNDSIVTFVKNEYKDNNYLAGQSYSIRIRYVSSDGTEENISFTIKVLDSETQAIKDKTVGQIIGGFFTKYWGWFAFGIIICIVIYIATHRKPKSKRK